MTQHLFMQEYIVDKYQAAYAKRLSKLKSDNNSPKAIARLCASDRFLTKSLNFKILNIRWPMLRVSVTSNPM